MKSITPEQYGNPKAPNLVQNTDMSMFTKEQTPSRQRPLHHNYKSHTTDYSFKTESDHVNVTEYNSQSCRKKRGRQLQLESSQKNQTLSINDASPQKMSAIGEHVNVQQSVDTQGINETPHSLSIEQFASDHNFSMQPNKHEQSINDKLT